MSLNSSCHATLFPLNQDLRHSIAWILSMPSLFLRSVIVIFAPENRRSGSADMAGIDNMSKAIIERAGYVLRCVASNHQDRGSLTSGRVGACRYLVYSSISSLDRCVLCCHCWKRFCFNESVDLETCVGTAIAVDLYSVSQKVCIFALQSNIHSCGQLSSMYCHLLCSQVSLSLKTKGGLYRPVGITPRLQYRQVIVLLGHSICLTSPTRNCSKDS